MTRLPPAWRLSLPASKRPSGKSEAWREACLRAQPAMDLPLVRGRTLSSPIHRANGSGSVREVIHAFVLIDAEPARVAGLASELADVDGVAEVYSVAGEVDLVAIVRVRHHDELAEVVTQGIAGLEGIVGTRTLIAFRAYSRHDLEAMFDLGQS